MKAFENVVISTVPKALNPEIYMSGLERSNKALITVERSTIRYRADDGNPSATVGLPAGVGDVIELISYNEVQLFRAIRSAAADATLNVDFS